MTKQLLFSVTAADCEWSYTRGTGSGGQAKNKTSSAVHCMHRPSGAHGYAEDNREQRKNRSLAFERMANSKEFQKWNKLEAMRRSGAMAAIEDDVARQMRKIRVDVKVDGLWKEVDKDAILPDEVQSE